MDDSSPNGLAPGLYLIETPDPWTTAVGWRHDHGQTTIPERDGPADPLHDPPTTEELAARGFFPETT